MRRFLPCVFCNCAFIVAAGLPCGICGGHKVCPCRAAWVYSLRGKFTLVCHVCITFLWYFSILLYMYGYFWNVCIAFCGACLGRTPLYGTGCPCGRPQVLRCALHPLCPGCRRWAAWPAIRQETVRVAMLRAHGAAIRGISAALSEKSAADFEYSAALSAEMAYATADSAKKDGEMPWFKTFFLPLQAKSAGVPCITSHI